MPLHLLRTARRLQAWLVLMFAGSVLAASTSPMLAESFMPGAVCRGHVTANASPGLSTAAFATPEHVPSGGLPSSKAELKCPQCLPLAMSAPPGQDPRVPQGLPDTQPVERPVPSCCVEPVVLPPARAPPSVRP